MKIFNSYDEQMAWYTKRARVYKAVGHPVRLQLVELLTGGEMSVGGLQDQLEIPQSQISQHLKALRDADVVRGSRVATTMFYELVEPDLAAKLRSVTEGWVE